MHDPYRTGLAWDRIISNRRKQEAKVILTNQGSRCALILLAAVGLPQAQVPADIEAGLRKIGQIVDPACTAKLYRPLMPKNDVNSNATPLYPGITVARDVSFGPHPKDLVDIFTADKGSGHRTVLIYVPGGGGNKTEQD